MLPIYIVSLARDVQKRTKISKTMESYGLNFEFIDAVEGKFLLKDEIIVIQEKAIGVIKKRNYPATFGEIGCSMSHCKVYKIMEDHHLDWVCILEDDIILDERFLAFYQDFNKKISLLKKDNLYLLGGQNGLDSSIVFKSAVRKVIIGQQIFTKTLLSSENIYRTCCYLMSNTMAKKIVDFSSNQFFVADDWALLSQKKIIKHIYLADFIDHPIDLSDSLIEKERQNNLTSIRIKDNFFIKVKNFVSWKLRLLWIKIAKFL